jgi:hypothetical protein
VGRAENLLPSVSRLSRQCGILNITQPYRLPRPITGIALLFTFTNCNYSYIHKQMTHRLKSVIFWAVTILRLVHRYQITPIRSFPYILSTFPQVDFPSSLKKEGVVPSETLGTIYQATRRYISEPSRPVRIPILTLSVQFLNSLAKWILVQWVSRKVWCMELAQDRVQWRALASAVSNLRVLLSASYFIRNLRLRGPGCEAKRTCSFFKTIRSMKYDLTE